MFNANMNQYFLVGEGPPRRRKRGRQPLSRIRTEVTCLEKLLAAISFVMMQLTTNSMLAHTKIRITRPPPQSQARDISTIYFGNVNIRVTGPTSLECLCCDIPWEVVR